MTRRSVLCSLFSVLCLFSGCGPTYPKERIKESIVDICKKEYKIDVKASTAGKTIGIYLPLPNLIDFTFAITKDASDKINDVLLSVTRVALSTDARYDFYCVIAHDVRIPEIQVVIIKSVDDVKRFFLQDISRGEYSKRMIIDMRVSPQAEKERTIRDILGKMKLDEKTQEDVMNDFFRTEPSELGEIGYWNDKFYLKGITLAEFIAEQIASRIKMEFREDKDIYKNFSLRSAKGRYVFQGERRLFSFEALAVMKEKERPREDIILRKILDITGGVIHSYRFTDFDFLDILERGENKFLRVSRDDLELYRVKKLRFENLIKAVPA